MTKEAKRMLFNEARNRLVLKLLQLINTNDNLGAIHACEEVLKLRNLKYEVLEIGGKEMVYPKLATGPKLQEVN